MTGLESNHSVAALK